MDIKDEIILVVSADYVTDEVTLLITGEGGARCLTEAEFKAEKKRLQR